MDYKWKRFASLKVNLKFLARKKCISFTCCHPVKVPSQRPNGRCICLWWENFSKRLQVCSLVVLELSTYSCELFIRRCGEDNLKGDTDTLLHPQKQKSMYKSSELLILNMGKKASNSLIKYKWYMYVRKWQLGKD